MKKIKDYECKYSSFHGLLTVRADVLGLVVPDLYQHADMMAKMAAAMKEKAHAAFSRLPIDTIALAENIGASALFDISTTGPRSKEYVVSTTKEVLDLPKADPGRGRMAEIMEGLCILRSQGELAAFSVRGLFDTLSFLLDLQQVIMDFSMDPGLMQQVCDRIREDIVVTCRAAEEAGARVITYADGAAGLKVIGPRFAAKLVDIFIYPLMKDLEEVLSPETLVQLCPKTSFMLVGCEKAAFRKTEAVAGLSELENLLQNPVVRWSGSRCNREFGEKAAAELVYLELA